MNANHLVAAGALTLALGLSAAAPASAASPWRLSAAGLGTAAPSSDGGHQYAGTLSGTPFGGAFTGSLSPGDGSLPGLGDCEPASATLRVEGSGGRYYQLASEGQVCSWLLPLGTMHQFTGRWTVDSTNVKKLARATGQADFRVLNGQSDIYVTEG